eukprot:CAMPEP_0202971736 /NCGR_PEP_ID=MMETSP1396-20130829/30306_1 /ASSEMBLY_ACC=CAM_ASM_000872 /TAXON_ID= /ORGANISM="Pseudokeronopsis sp., Strain Brazil" /LENGTH=640 /DNA_ID=CAMNT_0049701445 /DNA_START=187 /DNA_END=2109 /DNA_ORIENTATION=-
MAFQAETRKLLDIVTNSIYTDRDVFIRELISNASDALEKYRYSQVKGVTREDASGSAASLGIQIFADSEKNTLTIVDNGIGMSKEELISNLGTIARSGSKNFVEETANSSDSLGSRDGIIGQFGVGFYSAFMVAEKVSFESISALGDKKVAHRWSSTGTGEFTIEEMFVNEIPGVTAHGSRITMHLKESCKEFSDVGRIKGIIKHYSAFVSFPISVNDEAVNTIQALWSRDKKDVTDGQYKDFYQFLSGAHDEPRFRLHFRTDAPLDLKVLLFVPFFHSEKFGMGAMEPGVNLYSRRVLIESKPKDLLPDWLRFIKGAVDSEDLPLSLSREKPQDSSLLRRIKEVLTRRILKMLEEEKKNNLEKYKEFYLEFQVFLKQGACQDYAHMDSIAKLLLFESTSRENGELISLDDYVSRLPPDQKNIYYIVAPNRESALNSPYMEAFKSDKSGAQREVLLLYNSIDEFVMSNLKSFSGRTLVSAENTNAIEPMSNDNEEEGAQQGDDNSKSIKLSESELTELCGWLRGTLGDERVREVRATKRLRDSPAVITDHESGSLRRMLRMVEQANNRDTGSYRDLPPQVLEINPSHPLIVALHELRSDDKAKVVAEQMFDNALVAAGLLEDPRSMLSRLNNIMLKSLQK